MITALDTAKQGLLQAERRATDIAKDILKTTREAASFSASEDDSLTDAPRNAANTTIETQADNSSPGTTVNNNSHPGFGNLIQQFSDLRAEQRAFEANAKVFKAADESLGTLLDDLG